MKVFGKADFFLIYVQKTEYFLMQFYSAFEVFINFSYLCTHYEEVRVDKNKQGFAKSNVG